MYAAVGHGLVLQHVPARQRILVGRAFTGRKAGDTDWIDIAVVPNIGATPRLDVPPLRCRADDKCHRAARRAQRILSVRGFDIAPRRRSRPGGPAGPPIQPQLAGSCPQDPSATAPARTRLLCEGSSSLSSSSSHEMAATRFGKRHPLCLSTLNRRLPSCQRSRATLTRSAPGQSGEALCFKFESRS